MLVCITASLPPGARAMLLLGAFDQVLCPSRVSTFDATESFVAAPSTWGWSCEMQCPIITENSQTTKTAADSRIELDLPRHHI